MLNQRKIFHTILLTFVLIVSIEIRAQEPITNQPSFDLSEVFIVPTRVLFKNNSRTAEIVLLNKSQVINSYRIGFINLKMLPTGDMREIMEPDSGAYFVDSLIRYSPKQIIIEPGKSQTVRLQLIKPLSSLSGEFRSHIRFLKVPTAKTIDKDSSKTAQGIGINLIPIFGISIPVIARAKDCQVTAEIKDVKMVTGLTDTTLQFELLRTGNRSVFGELIVQFFPNNDDAIKIGTLRNLVLYSPLSSRKVHVQISVPAETKLRNGYFKLTYYDGEEEDNPELTHTIFKLE